METIKIVPYKSLDISLDTENFKYLKDVYKFFEHHIQNYQFMPMYQQGKWNGKKSMFRKSTRSLPYGLLTDLIKFTLKNYKNIKFDIHPDVKTMYTGFEKIDVEWNLLYKPHYYQEEVINCALKSSKGIFRCPTACHVKGDKVLMFDGTFKNIENILKGDIVVGKDGKPKNVIETFKGYDDVYEIDPKNNRQKITVSKNHLLHLSFTREHKNRHDKKYETNENIKVIDFIKKSNYYKHVAKLTYSNENINFIPKTINCKLSPYFIGLYIGDGHTHSCAVTNIDEECIKAIYQEAKKFNMNVVNPSYKLITYIIKGSIHKRNIIFREFEKIGIIFGTKNKIKCEDRFIPQIIFHQSINYRLKLLAGLIDSDGYLANTYFEFTSKSKKLANDVKKLSISVGLCVSSATKIVNNTNYYRICIMGNIHKIPVRIKRKKPITISKTNSYKSGFNINYVGKNKIYGIKVEDDLYITNDGMITHNSGKSLIISYIIREIIDKQKTDQALIIVPTISLVNQFKNDMIDYYIPENKIGMVDKDHKEWDKDIVVSTWQSLSNNINELKRFNCVVVDEVHSAKADILNNILKNSPAKWRFGFTGTMPKDPLDYYQVQSYLGPVLKHYKSSKLAKEGYIATCNVKIINIDYNKEYKGSFPEVKNEVFANHYRLNIIKQLTKNVDGSILLLVDKIDNEGKILEKFLNEQQDLKDKEIFFLYGDINAEERILWQKRTNQKKNIILIATFGVFQLGINIKSLKYCALCSSFKSSIRILQSVGRALRKHKSKEKNGAFIFDLNDQVKYLNKHGDERKRFYMEEGFDIKETYIDESQPILNFKELCQ